MPILTVAQQSRLRGEFADVFVEPGSPLSQFVDDEGFIKAGAPVSAFVNDANYTSQGSPVSQFANDAGYITTRLVMRLERNATAVDFETHELAFTPRGDVLVFLDGVVLAPDLYALSGATVTFDPVITGDLVIYYGSNP
jgi:hypothetical protein